MAFDPHNIFAYSTVLTIVSQSGTTLVINVQAGDGALFSVGQQVTLGPVNSLILISNGMIGRITGIATDQITIDYSTGNREGSNVRTVLVSDVIVNDITPKVLTDIETAVLTGWTPTNDIFTYVSANSFKITGVDRTAIYTPGTRIKFTNNSVTYNGVVQSRIFSTDTTVTLFVNNDFSIANLAITSPFYSYVANPQGFPYWFNFTPTITNPTGATGVLGTNFCKFRVIGKEILYMGNFNTGTIGGTITGDKYTFTTPVAPDLGSYGAYAGYGHLRQGGSRTQINCFINGSSIDIERYDDVTLSQTVVEVTFNIIYQF